MVVLFKVALYNKNTILPSAQSPTRLLLPSLTNKFLLSLPHPHAFRIPPTPCPSDRRRRRHAHFDRAFVFTGANAWSLPVNIPDWSKITNNRQRRLRRKPQKSKIRQWGQKPQKSKKLTIYSIVRLFCFGCSGFALFWVSEGLIHG
jgi:hypothetical protein